MSWLRLCNFLLAVVMLLRSGQTVPGGRIKACTGTKCKLCKFNGLNSNPETNNYQSNSVHCVRNNFSCNSSNVIYIIECTEVNCKFQYIGETKQTIRARANGHRSSLKSKKGCPHLVNHFTKHHAPSNMVIKPIEQLFKDDTKCRRKLETQFIKEFGTLYPYGGNERFEDPYIDAQEYFGNGQCIFSLFNHVKSSRGKRGGKCNQVRNINHSLDREEFDPEGLVKHISQAERSGLNVRHVIMSKVNALRKVDVFALETYNQARETRDKILKNMLTDMCRHYVSKLAKVSEPPSCDKSNFIVFEYVNRYLEEVNLSSICNDKEVKSVYPLGSNVDLTVSYRYTDTIRNKILNYGTSLLKDCQVPESCECHASQFVDSALGHVVTGDLSIIPNKALRNLLCKGIKFRECSTFTIEHLRKSVVKDIDDHIKKVSVKKSLPESTFVPWKLAIIDKINKKISTLKVKRSPKPRLNNSQVKASLKSLHERYVFVPTDKAENNVSIVCKKYYMDVLQQELESCTYVEIHGKTENDIVEVHTKELKDRNISVGEDNKSLPYMYWTPKQHKTPTSSRFIVSGKTCSVKQLSKKLSFIFKLVMRTLKQNLKYKAKFLKTNLYWIIDNSKEIQDSIKFVNNSKSGAKSINSYDFSQLYTNIPHNLLIEQMKFVVDEAFKIKSEMNFIKVTATKATWVSTNSSKVRTGTLISDSSQIVSLLEFLLDNLHIKHLGKIFKQVIGIPMGSDCGPDLANLFLFAYEYKYVINLIDVGDTVNYHKLRYIFRYIDDLLSLNDMGYFDSVFKDIYPSELVLNLTNINSLSTNYLDMTLTISDKKFNSVLYDKRNDYSFQVISLPNLKSNIPISAGYSVIYSQIVRYFKATNNIDNFNLSLYNLKCKMVKQNFSEHGISKQIRKFFNNNQYDIISKYWRMDVM